MLFPNAVHFNIPSNAIKEKNPSQKCCWTKFNINLYLYKNRWFFSIFLKSSFLFAHKIPLTCWFQKYIPLMWILARISESKYSLLFFVCVFKFQHFNCFRFHRLKFGQLSKQKLYFACHVHYSLAFRRRSEENHSSSFARAANWDHR